MKFFSKLLRIKNKQLRFVLKLLISLLVIYHLAMIIVVPQRMSMIHERLMPYFSSYAYTLSLAVSWDFYAPNPSIYYYFEYEVIDAKDRVEVFRWPPSRKEFKKGYMNHNRLIYHSRFFMLLGQKRIRRHFMPYLCRLHPSAREISVKAIVENRPHFKKARVFDPGFFSAGNKENMRVWFTASSRCKRSKKTRELNTTEFSDEE